MTKGDAMSKTNQHWISLFEYSSKHDLSLSTLRRRIKAHSIPFKLDGGKYYLLDEAAQPSQPVQMAQMSSTFNGEASILASANKLVEELKAAYAKILQEKEEQISLLKEDVVDLKMLVNLLEKQVAETKEELQKKSERGSPRPESNLGQETNFFFPEITEV